MKRPALYKLLISVMISLSFVAQSAFAYVPIRISIKWIVDATGSRSTTGNLNTDNEINAEVDAGNSILASNYSEFRLEVLDLYDLSGVSQYYSTNATTNNCVNVGNLRTDAVSNPAAYGWRSDAINIYINGGASSACSNFPPDNDIIFMNQW